MLTTLAQTDTTTTPGLASIAGIIALTWVLVGLAKKFFAFHGRTTLAVSLGVSIGLTILALATGRLADDAVAAIIGVIVLVAGASGVDAGLKTLVNGSPKVLALLAATLLITGCASVSPSQRYAITSNAFVATNDATAELLDLGLIPDESLDDIEQIVLAIDAELDALDRALRDDIPLNFRYVLARVEPLLGRLVQYQLDAEGSSHADTHPAPMAVACLEGHRPLRQDSTLRLAGDRRGPRLDRRGTGRDRFGADAFCRWPDRRHQLASQLRQLAWRYNRLTVRAAA